MSKLSIISYCLLLTVAGLQAQQPPTGKGVFGQPVMPGPASVLVFAYDTSTAGRTFDKNVQYSIYREESQKGFRKIATLSWPSSPSELEKRLGTALTQEMVQNRKLGSAAGLLKQLETGKFDTLGVYLGNLKLWEAMGMLYIDKEKDISDIDLRYKVDAEKNGVVKTLYQPDLRETKFTALAQFKQYARIMTDSLLMVTWYAKGGRANAAKLFAASAGTKIRDDAAIQLFSKKDTLFASYATRAVPGQRMELFIRATDMAGNTGFASDTMQLMALSTTHVSSIQQFKATDTAGGVLLQWNALPAKAYYTGIQVFKSRSATDEYIVVDTLPATAVAYLDTRVLPGVQYYYAIEPVLFKLPTSGKVAPALASVSVKGNMAAKAAPLAPQGLQARLDVQRNIVLSWEPNSELDLFAYYVLRGTSPGNMQVISSPVRDTVFVDSLQQLSGGTAYLYAVRAINMHQLVSDTSELISMISPKARPVTAPGGITARYMPGGVSLRWHDAAVVDHNVSGYALYRRNKGETYFQLLNQVLIPGNFYTDSTAPTSADLEYGVTAADALGNQSLLSPLASVNTENGFPLYPPADFSLRNLSTGIVISVAPAAGDQQKAGGSYFIYRRGISAGSVWKKIGEMPVTAPQYIDKTVQKDQLYIYALSIHQQKKESRRSEERSIRRK